MAQIIFGILLQTKIRRDNKHQIYLTYFDRIKMPLCEYRGSAIFDRHQAHFHNISIIPDANIDRNNKFSICADNDILSCEF